MPAVGSQRTPPVVRSMRSRLSRVARSPDPRLEVALADRRRSVPRWPGTGRPTPGGRAGCGRRCRTGSPRTRLHFLGVVAGRARRSCRGLSHRHWPRPGPGPRCPVRCRSRRASPRRGPPARRPSSAVTRSVDRPEVRACDGDTTRRGSPSRSRSRTLMSSWMPCGSAGLGVGEPTLDRRPAGRPSCPASDDRLNMKSKTGRTSHSTTNTLPPAKSRTAGRVAPGSRWALGVLEVRVAGRAAIRVSLLSNRC